MIWGGNSVIILQGIYHSSELNFSTEIKPVLTWWSNSVVPLAVHGRASWFSWYISLRRCFQDVKRCILVLVWSTAVLCWLWVLRTHRLSSPLISSPARNDSQDSWIFNIALGLGSWVLWVLALRQSQVQSQVPRVKSPKLVLLCLRVLFCEDLRSATLREGDSTKISTVAILNI